MTDRQPGILRYPVLFEDGVALPSQNTPGDPQLLWAGIEKVQAWTATNVLELDTLHAYTEPVHISAGEDKVAEADYMRQNSGNYHDDRGISNFAYSFRSPETDIIDEFREKSVLEIGSGRGVLADEFRRFAGARVLEIDFSQSVLESLPPVYEGMGQRVVADGTDMSFDDGIVDRTVSFYSTSLHTSTVESRLRAYVEAFRVTKPGGSVFVGPVLSEMFARQDKWREFELGDGERNFDRAAFKQAAARDFALVAFLRKMMADKRISFTPILKNTRHGFLMQYDTIAGIFDILEPFEKSETEGLIAPHLAPFARLSVNKQKTP